MKTSVKCECGKLQGEARLYIGNSSGKPQLAWTLTGEFFFYKGGRNSELPNCSSCKKPALGSDWKNVQA